MRVGQARIRHPHSPCWQLDLSGSTVHVVLRRLGRSRLNVPERDKDLRYEWPQARDLVHLDIKRLGRIGERGGRRMYTFDLPGVGTSGHIRVGIRAVPVGH